ncbi:MBL fold metallo-hydrolase [Paraflavitalea sp. CAU 1676]|uniref:MBL fold metallo-hydrolase n=1 Tax=Paraflavitalea sp. CAU 1676 TaxID=3032598 RepID=UPI0023DA3DAF|nr:MBL fold metallo-hydrolase [Paraflavitalea sp. CAU 1676]MDF2193777.1 MBL fold metallo-hydrolase [Paraflavitalea sp. CAU 1676]
MQRRTLVKKLAAIAALPLTGIPVAAIAHKGEPAPEAIATPRPAAAQATLLQPDDPASSLVFDPPQEIAPGVYFLKGKTTYFASGNLQEVECNNGWIIFDDFVLLIDANYPAAGPTILQEVRKTTNKPIRFVFNTHHHGDHLYGNGYWAQQGATAIAYEGLIGELQRFETGYYGTNPGRWEQVAQKRSDLKGFTLLPPPVTFKQSMVIEDKHRRVELLHLGTGHTMGDGVVWLPKESILFTGDSCLNGPYNLFRDADIKSWIPTLDRMAALKPAILIPGHGALGNAETPERQQHYFRSVYEWVSAAKKAGKTFEQIAPTIPALRQIIAADPIAVTYLIPAPEIAPGFSLEAHVKRIFETI